MIFVLKYGNIILLMKKKKLYNEEIKNQIESIYNIQCLELRKEIVEIIHIQVKYIQLGILCLAGSFTYVFSVYEDPSFMSYLVQLFLIPLICYGCLCMWLGEISRMMNYGNYLLDYELKQKKLLLKYENPILNDLQFYETWIRENQKSSQQSIKYLAVVFIFILIALVTTFLSICDLFKTEYNEDVKIMLSFSSICIAIFGLFAVIYSLYNIYIQSQTYKHFGNKIVV